MAGEVLSKTKRISKILAQIAGYFRPQNAHKIQFGMCEAGPRDRN